MFNRLVEVFKGGSKPSMDEMLEDSDRHLENFDTLIQPAPESRPRTPFNSDVPVEEVSMANLTTRQKLSVLPKALPLFANMQTAILYPFHWPFLWLPVPKQVVASIVLHVILAGWGTLAYARRSLNLNWFGALTAAVIFALGGFVGAQVEHVNQLNVVAWLPWAFLLLEMSVRRGRRLIPTLGLGLVIGLMLLAGHAQATYICLVGLGLYALAGGAQISKSTNQQIFTLQFLISSLQPLPATHIAARQSG